MRLFALLAVLALAAPATAAKEPPPTEPTTPPDWAAVRQQVEAQVISRMVDPESARIAWRHGFRWGGYKPMLQKRVHGYVTCGSVNSKNRMGGYVGDSPFVAVYADGAIRYLEIESASDRYGLLRSQCEAASFPAPQPELVSVDASKVAASSMSLADELEKLAVLRDKGIIAPAEFDAQKAKLLSR